MCKYILFPFVVLIFRRMYHCISFSSTVYCLPVLECWNVGMNSICLLVYFVLPSFQLCKLDKREEALDLSLVPPVYLWEENALLFGRELCDCWIRHEGEKREEEEEGKRFPSKKGRGFVKEENLPLLQRFTNRFHLNGFFCFFLSFFSFNGEGILENQCNFPSHTPFTGLLTWICLICLLSFCYGVAFDRYDRNFCLR